MANEPLLRQLQRMKQRMDALYNVTFPPSADAPDGAERADWTPDADVLETDTGWLVLVDLPGVDPEDLEVTVVDGGLRVTGNRARIASEELPRPLRRERPIGRFFLHFALPEEIAENAVSARYERGVLTVSVSKSPHPASPGSRIEVRQG